MLLQSKAIRAVLWIFAVSGILLVIAGIVLPLVSDEPLVVLCVVGAIFAAVGIVPLSISKKPKGGEEWLLEKGLHIEAEITDIEVNYTVLVNGKNPCRLICEGKLPSGETRTFRSGNIYKKIDRTQIGKPIMVYVAKDDPGRYLVDLLMYK